MDDGVIAMTENIQQYPWLLTAWQKITSSLEAGLPHGLLLHAPNGFGKHIIANELAKLLLCQDRGKEDLNYCNQCQSCLWFGNQQEVTQQCHPDCYPVFSASDSGIIKIDEIRALIANLSQTANQAGWKISIIFKAHQLNNSAFNAFLKTLEEPTDNTLFLLLADDLRTVPLTILSRVQRLSLSLNCEENRQLAVQWLSDEGKYTEKQINQVLLLSNDAPLLAKNFLQDDKIQQYQQWMEDLLKLGNYRIGSLEMAKKWKDLKEDNIIWLYQLIQQKISDDAILDDIGRYREWLVYEQELKKHESSWLQNLNDLLVLQNVYTRWQECCAQQALA